MLGITNTTPAQRWMSATCHEGGKSSIINHSINSISLKSGLVLHFVVCRLLYFRNAATEKIIFSEFVIYLFR